MTRHDTIVIGAGVTGLTAAWRLSQAGRDVRVLEARDRVGGRLRTEEHGGYDFEIGGQWVSPDQTALIALLEELELPTFSRYREGASVYLAADGSRHLYDDELPLPAESLAEIERIRVILDELAAAMDPDRPWTHPQATELDSVTFEQWLEQQSEDPLARQVAGLFIGPAMLTKPTYSFSALQAVLMAASAGAYSHLMDEDFILDKRVVGGLMRVPLELAERLGERVTLSADVTGVEWSESGAVVHVNGETLEADHVILAVPPTVVRRIRFTPELPAEHRQAREHQSFGLVVKVQAHYATPFWREAGLSGTGFATDRLIHEIYDNTAEGAAGGTLVGFVSDVSADAVGRMSSEERRKTLLETIADYFGPEALSPQTYVESDWQHQDLTGGAFGTSFDVGSMIRYGEALHAPVGVIEFGSSDIAGLGFQHVDGAVRIGQRLADRLLRTESAQLQA